MTLRRFQIPSDEATTVTVCEQDPFGADVDTRYQELRRQIDRMSKEAE